MTESVLDKTKLLESIKEKRSVLASENELDQAMDSAFEEMESQINSGQFDVPVRLRSESVSLDWLRKYIHKNSTYTKSPFYSQRKRIILADDLLSAARKEVEKKNGRNKNRQRS